MTFEMSRHRQPTRFAYHNKQQVFQNRALTEDEIRAVSPSIFAEGKHESRSERFTYIPTIEVLRGLRREGFVPFMVCQSRSRIEGKSEFTKHMIRLRRVEDVARNGGSPESILVNAHDGTASYQMYGGYWESVCSNGLWVGDTISEVRIPHKGDVTDKVIDAAYSVVDTLKLATEQRSAMKALDLSKDEQLVYARAATELRWDEAKAPVEPQKLLIARRYEDEQDSLWKTFNRVQENVIRGGLQGRTENNRRTTTREVNGIDQNSKLNRALWTLAEEFRKLKSSN